MKNRLLLLVEEPHIKKDVTDFQIGGTLLDANSGQPLGRGRVTIAPATKRDDLTTVITGDDGSFTFTGLTPGMYALTGWTRGYIAQFFNQHEQFSSSVVVGPNLDTSHLTFRLVRGARISGVVVDEAGEPVRQAHVWLYLDGLFGGAETVRSRGNLMTDDQGAFHFDHLVAGRYLIAVNAQPWYAQQLGYFGADPGNPGMAALNMAYPVTFYGGATEPEAAARLTVAPGEKATVEIALQPVRAVRIPLSPDSPGGSTVQVSNLQVHAPDGSLIGVPVRVSGDDKGNRVMGGVAPGHYTLTTFTAAKNGPDEPGLVSSEIVINSNGYVEKTENSAFVAVTAKLQAEGAALPPETSLVLTKRKAQSTFSEQAGERGEIVFKRGVTPGNYLISLANAPNLYLKSISAEGARVIGTSVEIRSGTPVKLTMIAGLRRGQVTGTALRDGKPVMGALVLLVPADPAHNPILFRDQSNSDGSFQMSNVVPGAYTVVAMENGWDLPWAEPGALKKFMSRATAVQVTENGKHEVKVEVQ